MLLSPPTCKTFCSTIDYQRKRGGEKEINNVWREREREKRERRERETEGERDILIQLLKQTIIIYFVYTFIG